MNFDETIDRRNTNSAKWDGMAAATGVTAPDAISMWVADMDFRAADFLQDAVQGLIEKANYGYFTGEQSMKEAVSWWMKNRHGWDVEPKAITSTGGLGNGIAICLHTYTEPGDEVIIFTPVYHEFTAKINKTGRVVKESPLVIDDGIYRMDLEALEASLTGREKVVLFCSPHNPAGRVWTHDELRALADFCVRHDLLLISDEIHQDLVLPGFTHTPLPVAAPEIIDRLVMMTSASKTFNIAGARLGVVTIPDETLRKPFAGAVRGIDLSPNLLGCVLSEAAYSPRGAQWVDALIGYLDTNRQIFLDGIAQIPGLSAMPMQSTYLAWVGFANTGMDMEEVIRRVKGDARIAPSIGADFGSGGEFYLRFNIATQKAQLQEAVARLQDAFSDLQ
ncbi:MAG: PatB family C-S lyase [Roseovarius sp.]|nr:PatB family C-S lyase [Roseovarius sp.]